MITLFVIALMTLSFLLGHACGYWRGVDRMLDLLGETILEMDTDAAREFRRAHRVCMDKTKAELDRLKNKRP